MKGYQIPFTNLPVQEKPPNTIKMSEQHSVLVEKEILELLDLESKNSSRKVSDKYFSCRKEGWEEPSRDKSEKTQCIHPLIGFEN